MRAIDVLNESALVVQSIWDAQQRAAAEYRRLLRRAADGDAAAGQLAAESYRLHQALVQAAAVRLTTAWEVFLQDLLREYLIRRPGRFKAVWRLRGSTIAVTDETLEEVVEAAGRPFQDLGRAKNLLKRYLGEDLFTEGKVTKIDTQPVKELVIVRNAIVHLGGSPTSQFRTELETAKTAHGYLLSRPGPIRSVPATHFERLLGRVLAVANQLYVRTWQRPRA